MVIAVCALYSCISTLMCGTHYIRYAAWNSGVQRVLSWPSKVSTITAVSVFRLNVVGVGDWKPLRTSCRGREKDMN
jgi:hypothetical protein